MGKTWDMRVILLRHGSTPGNEEKRYIGRTDEPLSPIGRQRLLLAKERGFYPKGRILVTSPMKRAVQTAELLYPGQTPRIAEQLREIDFGAFEGRNYQELTGDPRYQAWIDSGGSLPFPGGEARESFVRRTCEGFELLVREFFREKDLQPADSRTADVILIAHGGTIMALLNTYAGGDYYDYLCSNGSFFSCRMDLRYAEGVQPQIFLNTCEKCEAQL